MRENTYVVIMAGGVGSRFWPYSRQNRPKQFLDILGMGKSLLRLTFERFLPICPPENILVVTNQHYAGLVAQDLPELPEANILLEPDRRNTAPCIAYAAYKIRKSNPNALLIVAPSDHAILKEEAFLAKIQLALQEASEGKKLITLGIQPHRPETGYGYIRYQPEDGKDCFKVINFTEKPDYAKAVAFLQGGDYVWNAGLFIWHVGAITAAFEKHLPHLHHTFELGNELYYTEREQAYIDSVYPEVENISIDYGIMEKADNVYVIPAEFGWSDLGSWASLHEIREKDENDNVLDGNILTFETKHSFIQTNPDKLTVVHGLEGYLVTEHQNVLLICKKDEEKKFREWVKAVKEKKGNNFL
jgi:mannose-1-phosphate guanylyltransferase